MEGSSYLLVGWLSLALGRYYGDSLTTDDDSSTIFVAGAFDEFDDLFRCLDRSPRLVPAIAFEPGCGAFVFASNLHLLLGL